MRLRTKQKKRILIVLVVGAVLAAAGAGAYHWRQGQRDRDALVAKDEGFRALEEGRYEDALGGIGPYLRRFSGRGVVSDDYVKYARAVVEVPQPNNKHLFGAIGALREALKLDAKNASAQEPLLDLYLLTGYSTEALALLETMLADAPGDLRLLAMHCDVLELRRQFDSALRHSIDLNERAPDDLSGHLRTLRLRLRVNQSSSEIEMWADAVADGHPDSIRFELIRTVALSELSGRGELDPGLTTRATESLDRVHAAASELDDSLSIGVYVKMLDRAERFAISLDVLRNSGAFLDEPLRKELALRLWYRGRFDEMLAVVDGFRAAGDALSAELLAVEIFSAERSGNDARVEQARAELSQRPDTEADTWLAVVDALTTTPAPADLARTLRAAIDASPPSALLHQARGDALEDHEPHLAYEEWSHAAALAPVWAAPLRRMAKALIASDRQHLAPAIAWAAIRRAPDEVASYETYLSAATANVELLDSARQKDLYKRVVELRKQVKGGDQENLLTIELDLLARTDSGAAERQLMSILSDDADISERTLLSYAAVAERAGTTLGSQFLDLSERLHGPTPRLAFARASKRARDGEPEVGLRELDALRARAADGGDTLDWHVARAGYLNSIRSPEAGAAWLEVATDHPDQLSAQIGALSSAQAWQDRKGIEKVIERVRTLTDEDGLRWKLARGRWLLMADDAHESEIAEATRILSDVAQNAPSNVESRVLLARGWELLGNLESAETALQEADRLSTDNTGVKLELARLALQGGRTESAQRQLREVLDSGDLAPSQVTRAAYLLASQGRYGEGAEILSSAMDAPSPPRSGLLLLARLYARLGEHERAIAICDRLMNNLDVELIELAAGLRAATGRHDDAEIILEQLDAVRAAPGGRPVVRARHAARWQSPEIAVAAYRTAINEAASRPEIWNAFLTYALARGDAELVESILSDARADDVETVASLRERRELVLAGLGDERLQGLFIECLAPDASREALFAAAEAVVGNPGEHADRRALADTVRELADSNPDLLSIHLLSAILSADGGDLNGACTVARSAAARFPRSVAAARLSANLLGAASRWSEATEAGRRWLERAGGRDRTAMAFVGTALIHSGQEGDAVALMQEDVDAASAMPSPHVTFVTTYLIAEARSGGGRAAAKRIETLATNSAEWRSALVSVAPARWVDATTATIWLRSVDACVPADDVVSRLRLAEAWGAAWERYKDAALLASAQKTLAPVLASEACPAQAHFVAGTIAMQAGRSDVAERELRAALSKDDRMVSARNNLAMVYADSGRWEKAVEQAEAAVRGAPGVAECIDTLAYALRKGGRLGEARVQLENAIRMAPLNAEFQVNLADVLIEEDRKDEARDLLNKIQLRESEGLTISPAQRERIAALRELCR